jgi:hypothetical protein
VSIAIPYISADIVVTSDATTRRIRTTIPEIHFFRAADDSIGDRLFTAFGHASGAGDVTVRMKQVVRKGQTHGLALGLDLRLPTGDERNLLGTGAAGVQPFAAWSADYQTVSPHVNLGYQWNGSSVLGGVSRCRTARQGLATRRRRVRILIRLLDVERVLDLPIETILP